MKRLLSFIGAPDRANELHLGQKQRGTEAEHVPEGSTQMGGIAETCLVGSVREIRAALHRVHGTLDSRPQHKTFEGNADVRGEDVGQSTG